MTTPTKKKPPYPLFDRVCTIYCRDDDDETILACVRTYGAHLKMSVRGKPGWRAITLKHEGSVLVLNKTKFVRAGFKGAAGAYNRIHAGTSTFFRHVVVRPKTIRERLLEQLGEMSLYIGCVPTPAFSAELGHYELLFALARATRGLVFDGNGMIDGDGRLVLDRAGKHDLQVWSPKRA